MKKPASFSETDYIFPSSSIQELQSIIISYDEA